VTASKETRSTLVFERGTYAAGVHREVVNLRSLERLTIQWSAFATDVGVTAQIRFFIATVDETVLTNGAADPLSNTDPAVNRLWAPLTDSTGTDVLFTSEPAGVPDSEALNLPTPELHSLCGTALLVQITVAGGDLTEFLMSARAST
jgi:hypothetical protein